MKFSYAKNKNILLIVFTLSVMVYFFVWSILKPYNYGPDEYVRFPAYYYIFINNRLPSGWEESIRNPIWGFSYAFYLTWLPGLLSVFFMKMVSIFTHSPLPLLIAARFPSVIAGSAIVFLTFKILDLIIEDEKVKWFVLLLFTFVPQLAFLSSYVNNDIFAVCGSMLIVYSWILIDKKELNIKPFIILSAGIVIVALSYYNSYGWILFSFVYLVIVLANRKEERKKILVYSLIVLGIVLLFTGFFVIRNIALYKTDIFGLKSLENSSEMYAIEELKPSLRNTLKNQGLPLISLVNDRDFIFSTERSFLAAFGYTDILAPGIVYKIYRYVFLIGTVGFVGYAIKRLIKKESKNGNDKIPTSDYKKEIPAYIFLLLFAACLCVSFLFLYYSWGTDYEPQGRYVFPIIPALVVIDGIGFNFVLAEEKISKAIRITVISVLTLLIFATSVYCFVFVYIPSEFALASNDNLIALTEIFTQ